MSLFLRFFLLLIVSSAFGTIAWMQQAPEQVQWLQPVLETLESWFTQAQIDSRNARTVIGVACGAFITCVLTGILWHFKRLLCFVILVGIGAVVGWLAGPVGYDEWLALHFDVRGLISTVLSGAATGIVFFSALDIIALSRRTEKPIGSPTIGGEKKDPKAPSATSPRPDPVDRLDKCKIIMDLAAEAFQRSPKQIWMNLKLSGLTKPGLLAILDEIEWELEDNRKNGTELDPVYRRTGAKYAECVTLIRFIRQNINIEPWPR